ncbi:MAG: family 16 glycosylhydrolase [Sedimentisphaeraceae bacterium JB056]
MRTKILNILMLFTITCTFTLTLDAARLEGRKSQVIDEPLVNGYNKATFDVMLESYPAKADFNPAFELMCTPVKTDKIRFVSNDPVAHVTEIRLFEPGMQKYPPVMGGEGHGISVPNLAKGATVEVSSAYDMKLRPPHGIVDDVISFGSRWVSGGSAPHTVTINMKEKKTVGCIQMVSGYLSGMDWRVIASNFYFEYFDGKEWKKIEGSGRRSDTELSSLAITLADDSGNEYLFIGKSEKNNWAVGKRNSSGNLEIIKEVSKLETGLYEKEVYRFELATSANRGVLLVDGRPVIDIEHDLKDELKAGIESLSSDVVLDVKNMSVDTETDKRSAALKDVSFECIGGELPEFIFDPSVLSQQFQLSSVNQQRIRVGVEKISQGQMVKVNGRKVSSLLLNLSGGKQQDVTISVTSADKSSSRDYLIAVLPVPPSSQFELAFSDEFDGDSLNMDHWMHRGGMRWTSKQCAENVLVKDGKLVIRLESDGKMQRTGGIISNEAFGYGYYETRAKLWKGHGWHASFWQMQVKDTINEIDCFESTDPYSFGSNLHYYKPRHIIGPKGHKADVAERFHTYAWEWTPDRVKFYFDGELLRDVAYPGPHKPQNVWLTCVAHPDASMNDLPGTVEYEYFRYYRKEYMPSVSDDAIIVDEGKDGYSEIGNWTKGEYPVSYEYDFETRLSKEQGSFAIWKPEIKNAGLYDVYVWNPYVFVDKNVPLYSYTVNFSGGSEDVNIRPMLEGQKWVKLGRYEFEAGNKGYVKMNVRDGVANRADAVMFKPVR